MTLLHTAIRVSDIESNVAFYDDLIGFEVVRSRRTTERETSSSATRIHPSTTTPLFSSLNPTNR